MSMLGIDTAAPPFTLEGTAGTWSLVDGRGDPVVLYFYPRDETSGCTQEGLDFSELYPELRKARATVFGISPDSVASHIKFKRKWKFTFDLLSDPEQQVCRAYGVIQEKSMYGRKYMGVERSTFIIDAEGVLRHAFSKVKVKDHARAVLAAVQAL